MTNWDKISKALNGLLTDITPDVFAEALASNFATCTHCALREKCDEQFFIRDKNGDFLKDRHGDRIENLYFPGCESIILRYLNEEIGESDAR